MAMGFYTIWCVFLASLLCCCSGEETTLLPAGIELSPEEPQACGMHVRSPVTGLDSYGNNIAEYLNNHSAFRCADTISSDLKKIFSPGVRNARIRADLKENLGNVCSSFVDVISVFTFYNKVMSGGICEDDLFTEDSLNGTDFCVRVKTLDSKPVVSAIEKFEEKFRSSKSAANEVAKLLALNDSSCHRKCGSGYARILCNAYYSIASLFSQEFPKVLATRGKKLGLECIAEYF